MSYYFSEPPYFLLVAGLFAALTSGLAFSGTLKQIVQKWSSDSAGQRPRGDQPVDQLIRMQTGQLFVPFFGITIGVGVFLASGLEVFGFTAWLSYAVAVPLTILISLLIWLQLGSMLSLIERKGFQAALDLDSWH